ncbi:MAG: zinc protease [Bacteroidota bacterium]|nr:zinc protease [Bacteroidota bacterium]
MRNLIISLVILTAVFSLISGCDKMNKPLNVGNAVLLPVKDDPTVSFRIWFKVGSQLDPAGKEGLAALTAQMLTEGSTKVNSLEQILDKLYPLATGYGSKVDKEMTVIYGRTHKDNLDEFYKLLTEAILKPAFAESDFNRIKSAMISAIEKDLRYNSDEELGKASLYGFVFEGTPYGHYTFGAIEGLKSITLDDIKKFYNKYYTKDNYVIGLAGGYDTKLYDKLAQDLLTLPDGKAEQPAKPVPAKIDSWNYLLVDKDCESTAISFGFPIDVLRGDDDFFALVLFNSWFGEHRNSSSHLYQVIREARGMNYGDYSYIETFLNGGEYRVPEPNNPRRQQIFEVWLRPVQNHQRLFALRAALSELKKVLENGMTQNDFELTKNFLYKYSLSYAQTTMEQLGYEIDSKFYGINDNNDYITFFRNKIKSLTLAQVNAAIKKHLQFDNIKFAIITKDAAKFKEDLVANVPSPMKYDTPKPPDVLEMDKFIEVFPLKATPDKIKIVSVEEMFQK